MWDTVAKLLAVVVVLAALGLAFVALVLMAAIWRDRHDGW